MIQGMSAMHDTHPQQRTSRLSKRPVWGWIAGMCLAMSAAGAHAQAELVPLVAQVKVSSSSARNYVVESLVTVVLMGGVLFLICKSSRRT
jgi:hypothetical protein